MMARHQTALDKSPPEQIFIEPKKPVLPLRDVRPHQDGARVFADLKARRPVAVGDVHQQRHFRHVSVVGRVFGVHDLLLVPPWLLLRQIESLAAPGLSRGRRPGSHGGRQIRRILGGSCHVLKKYA